MAADKIQSTEHPHIVKILGPSGIWQAAIKGTFIRVWALVGCYKRGMDEWETLQGFPTITAAQLHDALSYYNDHKDEIEAFIQANELAYDEDLISELEQQPEDQTVLE
ncbi:MAG: DUF433 domain-containing protein [candidate division KSB1 bacterium]